MLWRLTAVLCRPRTSKGLCGGCDQTSHRFSWPVQVGGADPLFYRLLSEHYRPAKRDKINKENIHRNKSSTAIFEKNMPLLDDYWLQSKLRHLHFTSSVLGRGTLIARQRLLIGPMTLEVEVEHKMRRQVPMYFSIVRRRACWASFVSLSTSVSNTTENESVLITIRAKVWYCRWRWGALKDDNCI